MTISEVSEMYGVSQDTLRYYERVGLIPPVPRRPNGIRDYDETSCGWLQFIHCMRDAGVPILMQAYPDEIGRMDFAHRRDALSGAGAGRLYAALPQN